MNVQNFDELQRLLSSWYEVEPSQFQLPNSVVRDISNSILREFYSRFGQLAKRETSFKHSKSDHGPLSCQDIILPVDELKSEGGFTTFCVENQGVFIVAASDEPNSVDTYASGDGVDPKKRVPMTVVNVPLIECLITVTLRETIMSVEDRYRRITPDHKRKALELAAQGIHFKSRYIWPEVMFEFHLSEDVWHVNLDGMKFHANRGLWRQQPSIWQEQQFEGG